jgi:hypothetical protein
MRALERRAVRKMKKSAPGRNRTCDLALRRHSLYPLSYRGLRLEAGALPRPRRGGGGEGDRTLDLRIANATLSQLSYSPKKGPNLTSKGAPSQSIAPQLPNPTIGYGLGRTAI